MHERLNNSDLTKVETKCFPFQNDTVILFYLLIFLCTLVTRFSESAEKIGSDVLGIHH